MTDRELHRLNRKELLELLISQTGEIERMREELKAFEAKEQDRAIRIGKAGSIAEAALDLNGVFEVAQAAAEQYLLSVREAESDRELRINEANARAQQTIADAEARAQQIIAEAEARAQQMIAEADAEAKQTGAEAKAEDRKPVSDAGSQAKTKHSAKKGPGNKQKKHPKSKRKKRPGKKKAK